VLDSGQHYATVERIQRRVVMYNYQGNIVSDMQHESELSNRHLERHEQRRQEQKEEAEMEAMYGQRIHRQF
jgi:hypothetical protein